MAKTRAVVIGSGARSAALTLPGLMHDVCSAVHPMAVCSPCFEQSPLAAHGLEWVHPEAPLADAWPRLRHDVLAPPHLPRHPLQMAKLGLHAIRSARALAEAHFRGPRAHSGV